MVWTWAVERKWGGCQTCDWDKDNWIEKRRKGSNGGDLILKAMYWNGEASSQEMLSTWIAGIELGACRMVTQPGLRPYSCKWCNDVKFRFHFNPDMSWYQHTYIVKWNSCLHDKIMLLIYCNQGIIDFSESIVPCAMWQFFEVVCSLLTFSICAPIRKQLPKFN